MNLHEIRNEDDDTLAYYRQVWRTWEWSMLNGVMAYRQMGAGPHVPWMELDPDQQATNDRDVQAWVARGRPTGYR